ncbi:MAG TPA: adenylate/guanylate cyclase domain-containing protein, partial [Phnomibacter sp.]|nr:adenylate/guanylate cyclase domain-containing protein [Phnomibacter sp.]
MICKIWQWYQNLGIHAGLGAQEVRHIRALNGMIPIVTGLLWLQLPFVIQLLPATKYIFAAFILWPALMQLLPLLHRKGYYTTARIAYSISTICLITFISLQLGPETANHLFMVAAIVGFFIIFPPSQIRILVSMVLIAILAFTALEVYFSSHDGLLQLPAEFIIIARWSSISAFVTIIVAITAYHYKTVTDAERDLEMEHRRSENLLLNILPATIANRLKKQEKTIADQIGHASVLFIDLVGFTALSGRIHHQRLVEILDQLFSEIDRIVTHHGLEKIKMIGDAYMVAGGVPEPKAEHHVAIAHCALDILKYIKSKPIPEAPDLGLRMGIHCGPLVAGVICKKKFAYDLWGDTVNLASRM